VSLKGFGNRDAYVVQSSYYGTKINRTLMCTKHYLDLNSECFWRRYVVLQRFSMPFASVCCCHFPLLFL